MNLQAELFPTWLLALTTLLAAAYVLRALTTENWRNIPQPTLTGWLATTALILLLWQLKAQVHLGLSFHLLGTSALTLIAGKRRAVLSIASLLIIEVAYGHGDWACLGLALLIYGLIPASITQYLLDWAQRRLPPNVFVYIFVNCFAASALSMSLMGTALCLSLMHAYPAEFLLQDALPYYFLLAWPEGFTSGLNLTLLILWQPDWVCSFKDQFYLRK